MPYKLYSLSKQMVSSDIHSVKKLSVGLPLGLPHCRWAFEICGLSHSSGMGFYSLVSDTVRITKSAHNIIVQFCWQITLEIRSAFG